MDLDGTHTEPKAVGDFPTRQPVSDESKDLPLSWGEREVPLTSWLVLYGRRVLLWVGFTMGCSLLEGIPRDSLAWRSVATIPYFDTAPKSSSLQALASNRRTVENMYQLLSLQDERDETGHSK